MNFLNYAALPSPFSLFITSSLQAFHVTLLSRLIHSPLNYAGLYLKQGTTQISYASLFNHMLFNEFHGLAKSARKI